MKNSLVVDEGVSEVEVAEDELVESEEDEPAKAEARHQLTGKKRRRERKKLTHLM